MYPFNFEVFGLQTARLIPKPMTRIHSHCEVEINLVEFGKVTYTFAGKEVEITPGKLHIFSGVTPHRIVKVEKDTILNWITIPLPYLVSWKLPNDFYDILQTGAILFDNDPIQNQRDPVRFSRWREDLKSDDIRSHNVTLTEVKARLLRMIIHLDKQGGLKRKHTPKHNRKSTTSLVTHGVSFMMKNFSDKILLEDIGKEVGVHPNYFCSIFKEHIGISPNQFLTNQRLNLAKLLIKTTDLSILEIALETGFPTLSRFYTAFKKQFGCAPKDFKHTHII